MNTLMKSTEPVYDEEQEKAALRIQGNFKNRDQRKAEREEGAPFK